MNQAEQRAHGQFLTDEEVVKVLGNVREQVTGDVFLVFARAVIKANNFKGEILSNPAFEQRCLLAEQCLPDAPYRAMLKKLHAEMLAALPAQQEDGPINEGWHITVTNGHSGYGVYAHMEDYPEEGAVLVQMIEQPAQKRPQNCGTSYCSCIECVMEPAQPQQEPVAWVGLDLDGMAEAFHRVIEEHHARTNPFHDPVNMYAMIALRELRGLIAYMKRNTSPPVQRQPLADLEQIVQALRGYGLTLVKTEHGYDVRDLGQINAYGVKEQS